MKRVKNHKKHRPVKSASSQEAARAANLAKGAKYRWVPGQSGNPGGRPPALLSRACREKLGEIVPNDPLKRTYARYFADWLAHKGMSGDRAAIVELTDRAEGRPGQSITINDQEDPLMQLIASMDEASKRAGPPEGMVKYNDGDDDDGEPVQ